MDRLEKYIKENQEALDRIEPVDADALWERIQAPQAQIHPLPPKAGSGWHLHIGRNWWLSAAAAVILTLGIGIWLYWQPGKGPDQDLARLKIKDYYPEIAEEEMAFRQTIARKEAELDLGELDRQQFIDIFNELDELEKVHKEQLKDLPEVFDNEEWVRTLMQYYEQKLRLLEHLSREIDKQERQEERHHARSI